MPGVATPQLLTYAEIVDVDLDSTNDVNFADVEDYGHRVIIDVNSIAINNYLGWERTVGSARPSANLISANEAAFKASIEAALSDSFVDIDGVTGGLHFGTANFDTNTDPRKRSSEGVSANDIPMCFVLYKLYGSSSVTTLDNIYNLQDAHGMLSNETVAAAITESFKTNETGALDSMFRDLLAADPHRFFDASGIPITGIFETNADVSGSGSWNITGNDTIEVKLKLVFQSKVSRRGIAGREHNLSTPDNATGAQENQQTVINPSDYFYIRLQIKAIAPPAAPTALSVTDGNGQTSISFTPGANGGKAITNYMYSLDGGSTFTTFSPVQTTSPVVIEGLTNGTTYNIKLKAINIIGEGYASTSISSTPATVPSVPTDLSATIGNQQVSISFTEGSNGGSVITNYQYSLNGGATFVSFNPAQTTSPVTITGLTNGTSYNIQLKAVNAIGAGSASSTVTASPGTTPSAPTGLFATVDNGQVIISFTAGPDGGRVISNYEYSINGGTSFTAFSSPTTTSPVTITGLTNGTTYSIQLRAVNSIGSGTASSTISATPYAVGVYVGAYYGGGVSVTVRSANDTTLKTLTNGGNEDSFIAKYTRSGTALWASRIGGTGFDSIRANGVDLNGNSYVCGTFTSNPLTVFNSDDTSSGLTLSRSGSWDVFLVKYNSSGTGQWAARVGGTGDEAALKMAVDASGNSYIAGFYNSGTLTIFNSDGTTFGTLSNSGSNDCFIIKYNTNGTAQWAARMAGSASDLPLGVALDGSGNIYMTGECGSSTLTLFNSDGSSSGITVANSGGNDGFIVKYNNNGIAQWGARVGSSSTDVGRGIATDASNNVYVTGNYQANVTFFNSSGSSSGITLSYTPSNEDGFLVKYDANGSALWATRISGTSSDMPLSVTTDLQNNVIVLGQFSGATTTILNSDGTTFNSLTNTSSGSNDTFLIKYNSSGMVQWGARIGGSSSDTPNIVSTDREGDVYVTGYFNSNTLTFFNSSGATFGTTLSGTGTGNNSMYIGKYSGSGSVQWVARVLSGIGQTISAV
jgi:hypothetical protein